jgi:dihydrofolate reductase
MTFNYVRTTPLAGHKQETTLRPLFSFMMTTLDGYHAAPDRQLDWANIDDDFNAYSISQLHDIGVLLFGRTTYEGMAAYWPTAAEEGNFPQVAELMNSLPKVVFSSTLASADWNNTTLVNGDPAETIAKLKAQPGKDLAVFGSSQLTVSLLEQGLVDELRVMVHPTMIGAGLGLFAGMQTQVRLDLVRTTTFRSGNVLLCYRPII